MKITISDIAKAAGVSNGSVSNALNNKKGIGKEKKEHILSVAKELGYFKKNDSEIKKIRFVIVKNEANVVGDTPFFSELIRGAETECNALGYEFIINYMDADKIQPDNLDTLLKTNQTSGILLLATEMRLADLQKFKNICIPLVVLDAAFNTLDFDYVAINNVDGTYEIIQRAIQKGHKNIGIINSSKQINNFKERKLGYMQALNDANLLCLPEYEALVEPTPDGAYLDMKTYLLECLSELDVSQLPTAFYAVNDNIAYGAIKAIQELNLDISICGFDDLPASQVISPTLTTVHVDKQYLGKTSVDRLYQKIINQDVNIQKILIATSVIERESIKNV